MTVLRFAVDQREHDWVHCLALLSQERGPATFKVVPGVLRRTEHPSHRHVSPEALWIRLRLGRLSRTLGSMK